MPVLGTVSSALGFTSGAVDATSGVLGMARSGVRTTKGVGKMAVAFVTRSWFILVVWFVALSMMPVYSWAPAVAFALTLYLYGI